MPGLTNAEAAATLDVRFPVAAAADYIAYSTDGVSEFAGLARTAVGATGWAAATVANPSIKANGSALESAAVTQNGTVSHFAIFDAAAAGNQRTDWTAFDSSRAVVVDDTITHAIGAIEVTLT